jgi:hypothetical protein
MSLKPMFFKRKILLGIAAVLVLSSCAVAEKVMPEKVEINILSGREGINGPVLAVKIDDTNSAHPQIGVEDADVVYIEQVESGLTRLMAIFSSRIPQRIGPVRSARISDIDILSQYGNVAFAYSGAQSKLLPVISQANLLDLGAQRQSPTIYTTDPSRNQPYAMVLRADLLMARIVEKQYEIDSARSVGFVFGDKPKEGQLTDEAVIDWPSATYKATWSESEGRWFLSHNGRLNTAESGIILGPTTFVIQLVSITPSDYGDKFGGVTPFSETVGQGKAYVLRNGKRFAAIWNRSDANSGTSFSLLNGEEIKFAPGQVWVALTDREPKFTSPATSKTK